MLQLRLVQRGSWVWCRPGEHMHRRCMGRLMPWLAEQPHPALGLHLQQGRQLGSSAGCAVQWLRGGR